MWDGRSSQSNVARPFVRALWLAGVLIASLTAEAQAGHGDLHAQIRYWNFGALGPQGETFASSNETIDDIGGVTAQVGAPAMVTSVTAVTETFGHQPGLLYWNPATNAFKLMMLDLRPPGLIRVLSWWASTLTVRSRTRVHRRPPRAIRGE